MFRFDLFGVAHTARLTDAGLQLDEGRVIPWDVLDALPRAYGVSADGWLNGEFRTESEALDRVAQLRAAGCVASLVRLR